MSRWSLLLSSLVACSAPTRPTPTADPASVASVPAPAPTTPCASVARAPDDPAEPTVTPLECIVTRTVRCVGPSNTTAAWQRAPFAQCPPTRPRVSPGGAITDDGQFSALETRRARCVRPDTNECCYVELAALTCR